ncbi:MAG: hypothetical protein M5U12_04755 [Verrucomicrobia bacterium]|nr:hypothetical protein [Verrucomicrobiota bacterium]
MAGHPRGCPLSLPEPAGRPAEQAQADERDGGEPADGRKWRVTHRREVLPRSAPADKRFERAEGLEEARFDPLPPTP